MATRYERLEESLEKAYARIEEIKVNLETEKSKILEKREEETKKMIEMKAKFEALYGKLPEDMNVQG